MPSSDLSASLFRFSFLSSVLGWLILSGARPKEALNLFVSSMDKDSTEALPPFCVDDEGDGDL